MASEAQKAEVAEITTGLPQLNLESFGNQIFWLVLTLLAIYFILSRIALPRIAGILANRQRTITGDLSAAEDFKEKARAAEAAYERALSEARAESQRIADAARKSIQSDLDAAIAAADAEISTQTAASAAAITQIRASAAEAVGEVARDVAADIVSKMGGAAEAKQIAAAVSAQTKG